MRGRRGEGIAARTVFASVFLLAAMSARAQIALPQPAASPAPTPAPIAPPVFVFPYPVWMAVVAGIAVALLIVGIIWAVVRHLRNRPQPPPPSPREVALAALERLRSRIGAMEPYPFSIEVSDVLRGFVADEFRVRATRQTSAEFLVAAGASPR